MAVLAFAFALADAPLWAQDDVQPADAPPSASSDSDNSASFQTFYDSLGSQGNWIQSSDYGYVWQPGVTDPDWAPYTVGNWAYTDDGWAWVSGEPWGWATYHYGRWVNLDGSGWVWVPGYTWAPAWVSWRWGGGYCGWAPLPPDSFIGIDYFGGGFGFGLGFHIGGDCDGFYGIGPAYYHFIPVAAIGYRGYGGYYLNPYNNYAIINHTTNVTNINVTRNLTTTTAGTTTAGPAKVTTGGPSLGQVNAVSETPLQKVNLVRTSQLGDARLEGNTLAVYAPRVSASSTAQPGRVARSIGPAAINRGTDPTRPLAVNSRLMPAAATDDQVQQAHLAQEHSPANAKVVTSSAGMKPILNTPLTSLRPAAPAAASDSSATMRAAPGGYADSLSPMGNRTAQSATVSAHSYAPATTSSSHSSSSGAAGSSTSHSAAPIAPSTPPPAYTPSQAPYNYPGAGFNRSPSNGGGGWNGGGNFRGGGGGNQGNGRSPQSGPGQNHR